jgi:KTSC domain-containing protein
MLSVNQGNDLMQTLVESSLLSSIEYWSDQTLELTFHSGATYRYFAVPQTVVEEFIAAESKGAYFNHQVRNRFRYQRL